VPELPEVQAHAERLTESHSGQTLARFEPISFTALKNADVNPSDAKGLPLGGWTRRGKFMIARFGDVRFVVHLMQGGRLKPDEKLSAKPRNGIARWRFDGDVPALLLTEAGKEHKAGVWVFNTDPLPLEPLSRLGPDGDVVTRSELEEALAAKNQRVHGFLRDQHGIAGLGRMLANEICHRAKLSPFAMTKKLTPSEVDALETGIRDCIADALAHERTLAEMSKSADRPGAVHRRKGETCPVCGDTIRAVEYNAYEVDYCPTCQTDGKVLADNTTSKFLK
jgi:formamidopyrimidine-DNA glycosylase